MISAAEQRCIVKISRVVAIQNYGCSGTTLMHSLLDNHPEVISMPLLMGRSIYFVWENLEQPFVFSQIQEVINAHLGEMFNVFHPKNDPSLQALGDDRNAGIQINKDLFFFFLGEHLNLALGEGGTITRKFFVTSFFLAYNACLQNAYQGNIVLCYPIHSLEKRYAQYLVEDFEEVYFLHMIREPVQNIGSLMRHINYTQMEGSINENLLFCAASQIIDEKSIHWGGAAIESYGIRPYLSQTDKNYENARTCYLKLESLHTSPEFTMHAVAKWLNISWHPTLLRSTVFGYSWHNRKESKQVSGFNTDIVKQSHDAYFTRFDKFRLRLLTKNIQKEFSYKKLSLLESFLYPFLPLFLLLPFKVGFNRQRAQARIKFLSKKSLKDTISNMSAIKEMDFRSFIKMLTLVPRNYLKLRLLLFKLWWKQAFYKQRDSQLAPLLPEG